MELNNIIALNENIGFNGCWNRKYIRDSNYSKTLRTKLEFHGHKVFFLFSRIFFTSLKKENISKLHQIFFWHNFNDNRLSSVHLVTKSLQKFKFSRHVSHTMCHLNRIKRYLRINSFFIKQ